MSPVYIYLAITAIALVVEFFVVKLISIWFAGGGVVAMALCAFGVEWYIHVPAFIVVSAVLILSLRKITLDRLKKAVQTKSDEIKENE